ncbi:MAG: Rieske (2Fe-2S) protein, partial [Gammaproteobacteria bacterium]|nr:Rieske (2Fe-2S) protein [Gammaproteobacteria bacterium]
MSKQGTENQQASQWRQAASLEKLRAAGRLLVRLDGKQLALFDTPDGIKACDNRCPHEGYPLTEGSLADNCVLTCNWHNWKFDLGSGENLYGGDRLRVYPLEVRGEDIWIDVADIPYADRYAAITGSLHGAFSDHAYARLAREIARLVELGADPLDCLRLAIEWSWDRLEFGWTHGYAGMADWLTLYQERRQWELQLVCLVESVAHAAFDVLRESQYPFDDAATAFDEQTFLQAIEQEDQT